MFDLRRLCTAPLCRHRTLSCPQAQPRTPPPPLVGPSPVQSSRPMPAPCQAAPWFRPSPSAPTLALEGTGGSCGLQQGPGQAGNQQRCRSAERARSAEGPTPVLPACGLHQDWCPGRLLPRPSSSLPGRAEGQPHTPEAARQTQPGEVTWARPGPCCRGGQGCSVATRSVSRPNTGPAAAHGRARSSARQAGQTWHQAHTDTQRCSPHAHSSLSSQQPPSAG